MRFTKILFPNGTCWLIQKKVVFVILTILMVCFANVLEKGKLGIILRSGLALLEQCEGDLLLSTRLKDTSHKHNVACGNDFETSRCHCIFLKYSLQFLNNSRGPIEVVISSLSTGILV